ncbi:MAG: hypothetical protein C0397_13240 [Odoribacter sp.]|nr:hypothetical protein [Odoribacter sp.]
MLAKGKPILFGEVGNPPAPEIYKQQPDWTSWVVWAGMVRNTTKKQYQEMVDNPRMLFQESQAYWEAMNPYRKVCSLPLLPLKDKYPVNFSGQWVFNEDKSDVGNAGTGNVAHEIEIDQDGDLLHVKKQVLVEWGGDRTTNETIPLDGSEMKSEFFNSPRISKASWDEVSKSVKVSSVVKFTRGGQTTEMKSTEEWSLQEGGKALKLRRLQPASGVAKLRFR